MIPGSCRRGFSFSACCWRSRLRSSGRPRLTASDSSDAGRRDVESGRRQPSRPASRGQRGSLSLRSPLTVSSSSSTASAGRRRGRRRPRRRWRMVRTRLERETGPVEDRVREAIALANNEIHRLAVDSRRVAGHGVRPDRRGRHQRRGGRRSRRRYAAVQAARRAHREAHARSLAGGRARGCRRAERARGDAASAAQRGLPRRRLGTPRPGRSAIHRRLPAAIRDRCGAAAVQRWADRSGRVGRRSPRSWPISPGIRSKSSEGSSTPPMPPVAKTT